jgi:signal transduction histidine kinase
LTGLNKPTGPIKDADDLPVSVPSEKQDRTSKEPAAGELLMQPMEELTVVGEQAERLRQLTHDLRSPLSILSMGVETLKSLRADEQQFDLVCSMLSKEGIEPLKEMISRLADEVETLRNCQ